MAKESRDGVDGFPELAGLPESPQLRLSRLWKLAGEAASRFSRLQSQGVPPPDGHPESRHTIQLYFQTRRLAEVCARDQRELLPMVRGWVQGVKATSPLRRGAQDLRSIFDYRMRILWLASIARLLEEDAPSDLLAEMEFELAHFEKVLALARKGAGHEAEFVSIRKELGEARRESLFKRGERLLQLAGWQAPASELRRVRELGAPRTSAIVEILSKRARDPFESVEPEQWSAAAQSLGKEPRPAATEAPVPETAPSAAAKEPEESKESEEPKKSEEPDNPAEPYASGDVAQLWDRFLEAVDIVTEIRRLPDVHRPGPGLKYLTRNLESLENQQFELLKTAFAALPLAEQSAFVLEQSHEVLDRSAEVMAAPLELDPETEVVSQTAAKKVAEHLLALGLAMPRQDRPVQHALKAVRKSLNRLRNEQQETGLLIGLNRWFGPVGRGTMEIVVLVATLLAVVLIFTQLYWLEFPSNEELAAAVSQQDRADEEARLRSLELGESWLALQAEGLVSPGLAGRQAFVPADTSAAHALREAAARLAAARREVEVAEVDGKKLRKRRALEVTLNWFDAALCAVLLLDFLLRFVLVRGRLRYFLRHVLVDVIPAIPFGLIIDGLEGMADPGQMSIFKLMVFVRLSKLAPVFRTVRPLVRLARVGAFALRGMDRMVRNLRRHVDRDVVLFGSAATAGPSTVEMLRREEHKARRRVRNIILAGAEEERLQLFMHWIRQVRSVVRAYRVDLTEVADLGPIAAPPIQLEALIKTLLNLTPSEVEEVLGPVMVRRMGNWISMLDTFLIRRLPVVRDLVRDREALSASGLIARACRVAGKLLQKIQTKIEWLADLHGVASGPQVLDWVGQTMVKSTERPAKRLILFGLGLMFANLLFGAFQLSLFNKLAGFLQKALGLPIIVIGVLCLLLMVLGRWFRWIAGEASDVYFRVAEAQYINLTEIYRYGRRERDLETLSCDVLRPESRVLGEKLPESLLEDTVSELMHRSPPSDGNQTGLHDLVVRVAYLYRDHLDGSPLHISDTKATEQLLGNLTVRSITEERLRYSDKDRKKLERVDLARARSLIGGPYIWFNLISRSLMEQTAKLLMEYNRFALPKAESKHSSAHALERFRHWLAGRSTAALRDRRERRRVDRERQEIKRFHTTYFDALHFLSIDPNREAALERKFGPEVMAAVRQDRREMVRGVFGSFPFDALPPSYRMVNIYRLYMGTMAGGRVLFMPLRIVVFGLKFCGFLFGRLKKMVISILRPTFDAADAAKSASFGVARRKINRLKEPSFVEALRLRMLFDPEYLGCKLPGQATQDGIRLVQQDLEMIAALDALYEEAETLREDREQALGSFDRLLQEHGGMQGLLGKPLARREALRAAALAFAIDYRGMRTLWGAEASLRASLERPRRVKRPVHPSWVGALKVKKIHFQKWLAHNPDVDLKAAKLCFRKDAGFRRCVAVIAYHGAYENPRKQAVKLIREAAAQSRVWSEQLVSLRALQALFVLQLEEYLEIVRQLGEYGGAPPPRRKKKRTLRSLRVRTDF